MKTLTITDAKKILSRWLTAASRGERVECLLALCELNESFGQPHALSGLRIRKLCNKLFECRVSLALRFTFQDRPTDLFVSFLGNHDEVKALLRSGKYR
jgi:hypothetical protein